MAVIIAGIEVCIWQHTVVLYFFLNNTENHTLVRQNKCYCLNFVEQARVKASPHCDVLLVGVEAQERAILSKRCTLLCFGEKTLKRLGL